MKNLNTIVSYINLIVGLFIIYTVININASINDVKRTVVNETKRVSETIINQYVDQKANEKLIDWYKKKDSATSKILNKSKIYQNLLKKR